MEITWLGHSCFRLRGKEGTVLTDPYPRSLGLVPGSLSAEVVTVSNSHPNHCSVSSVHGTYKAVEGPGEYEINNIMIVGVAIRGDRNSSAQTPRNTAFLMHLDDIAVCHLGDLSRLLTAEEIAQLKDAEVLLIPVGGRCTLNAAQAAEVVSQVEPRIVIPMHYGIQGAKVELEGVDKFCREMGLKAVEPEQRLSVTRSNLPEEPTVHLLSCRGQPLI